jgi:hypothetical protein
MSSRLRHLFVPVLGLGPPIHPALLKREQERAKARQNRAADAITTFAGPMVFVYLHVIWFACWIVFGVENYPYGLLTMIVALEAIFLSTFVMIPQNRADARRQVIADHQADGPEGGPAERRVVRDLQADPGADQGSAGARRALTG